MLGMIVLILSYLLNMPVVGLTYLGGGIEGSSLSGRSLGTYTLSKKTYVVFSKRPASEMRRKILVTSHARKNWRLYKI